MTKSSWKFSGNSYISAITCTKFTPFLNLKNCLYQIKKFKPAQLAELESIKIANSFSLIQEWLPNISYGFHFGQLY